MLQKIIEAKPLAPRRSFAQLATWKCKPTSLSSLHLHVRVSVYLALRTVRP